jgi:O-antigen biosynthesis protein
LSNEKSAPEDIAALIDTIERSVSSAPRPRILMLSHAWGGGVERHVQDLIALVTPHADVLVLRGFLNAGVDLTWYGATEASAPVRVGGFGAASLDEWTNALQALSFDRLHIHHLHGWPIEVLKLIDALSCPVDVTLHDYFYPCPQYHFSNEENRYCGQPDVDGCRACVAKRPHVWGLQIEAWRDTMGRLLARADRVIAPTVDVATRTKRYFPTIDPIVLPHPEQPVEFPRVIKVAILGGLSAIKGLAIVQRTVELARKQHSEFAFRLIGHASEPLVDGITATGTYDDRDLPRLIAIERPDVIWFPAQVPETFSYTLSVATATALPLALSDFECFRERLTGYARATYLPHDALPLDWLNVFKATSETMHHSIHAMGAAATSREHYGRVYCAALPTTDAKNEPVTASVEALGHLLNTAPTQPALPEYSLEALFKIGRYGGHRSSLDAIELHLAALPEHERQIVGRSVYEQVREHAEHMSGAYQQAMRGFDAERDAREQERLASVAAALDFTRQLDALQSELVSATREIAGLHTEIAQIKSSRSWRYTEPLRHLARRLQRVAGRFRH